MFQLLVLIIHTNIENLNLYQKFCYFKNSVIVIYYLFYLVDNCAQFVIQINVMCSENFQIDIDMNK